MRRGPERPAAELASELRLVKWRKCWHNPLSNLGERLKMIDNMFLLAVASLGWGLSLATYRIFARRQEWSMGALQIDFPAVPVLIGLFAASNALWFAAARGIEYGGWVIVLFGILLAVFWTGFLRVGSQISLFLAPIATVLLIAGWLSMPAA
jgi:hypothetical protein